MSGLVIFSRLTFQNVSTMSFSWIVLGSALILLAAYRTYGFYLSRILELDDQQPTPAHIHGDGVDYVPSKAPVVLGHHFASIAGAGPIVGPVIAVAFGWIPAVLWILIGGIFFGAVHDLTSLTASIRHKGKSIGEIIERYVGISGKRLFMIFAFATLILVIAVFMDIVAKTFVSVPSAATSSALFILLAVLFGRLMQSSISFSLLTILGVLLMGVMIWMGNLFPFEFSYIGWILLLMAYCFVAAITPVQLLLQPRDYLNSFLLYGMLGFGILGIMISSPGIEMSSEITFNVPALGSLFPVLFVTIACGAISGFHSLVASGTTSKQLNCETDARRVGYGGMLIESLLAIISVGTVVILAKETYSSELAQYGPVTMFSKGLGGFMASVGIPEEYGVSFVALTVSAFAVTTLDTCTRLARFIVQESVKESKESETNPDNKTSTELYSGPHWMTCIGANRYIATLIVVLTSLALLGTGQFQELWPMFGSANQLLAALALLAVTVWLTKSNKQRWFTLLPMLFMFAVTLSSLVVFSMNQFQKGALILSGLGIGLFILAIALLFFSWKALKQPSENARIT